MTLRRLLLLLSSLLVIAACSGGGDEESDPTTPVEESAVDQGDDAFDTEPITGTVSNDDVGGGDPPELGLFGDGVARARLTGREVEGLGQAYLPAIAVKVDNGPGARPQSGLAEADIVFEELVEGGLTRFFAIYQSQLADEIGPVRSARTTDITLLRSLGEPLFSWSGANAAFADLIRQLDIVDVGVEAAPEAYERRADRTAPSDLYTSSAALLGAAAGAGRTPEPLLLVDDSDLSGLSRFEDDSVSIDFGATVVDYDWDGSGWVRTQDGEVHVGADGEPLAPTNVIVRFVRYADTGVRDAAGAIVPEAVLAGEGRALFLLDGAVYEGQWAETGSGTIYLSNGIRVPVRPGTTWIALVPDERSAG